jgi:ribonucleoside-diphosphate reductase alpha chain
MLDGGLILTFDPRDAEALIGQSIGRAVLNLGAVAALGGDTPALLSHLARLWTVALDLQTATPRSIALGLEGLLAASASEPDLATHAKALAAIVAASAAEASVGPPPSPAAMPPSACFSTTPTPDCAWALAA